MVGTLKQGENVRRTNMNKLCRSKTCDSKKLQALSNFVKDSRYADGYQNRCKSCQKKYDAKRFELNRLDVLQKSKSYYDSNLESARLKRAQWRNDHKEYAVEYGKLYRQLNPGKHLEKTRRYQAAKMQAVPSWLTPIQIEQMQVMYDSCPEGYEVDHIIPLQGKDVKGLHVPWNLQHLPKSENRKKSNKY